MICCSAQCHTQHPPGAGDDFNFTPRSATASRTVIRLFVPAWNLWYAVTGYVEVNVRKDLGVEHPMYLLMDKSSKLSMDTLNGVNRLFVEMGMKFNEYLSEQQRKQIKPITSRASSGENELDPFRWMWRRSVSGRLES